MHRMATKLKLAVIDFMRVAANTRAQFVDALEAVARHEWFKL